MSLTTESERAERGGTWRWLRVGATVVVAAIAVALLFPRPRATGSAPSEPARPAVTPASTVGTAAVAPAPGAHTPGAPVPALPDSAPFREPDLALTTDMPEGPMVALRSAARTGRALTVELAATAPLADGKRVFINASVSDGLGNTILECTWRDIELTDEARKLDCELPADVELPLAIAAHQLPAPSFVESPTVVATDKGAH